MRFIRSLSRYPPPSHSQRPIFSLPAFFSSLSPLPPSPSSSLVQRRYSRTLAPVSVAATNINDTVTRGSASAAGRDVPSDCRSRSRTDLFTPVRSFHRSAVGHSKKRPRPTHFPTAAGRRAGRSKGRSSGDAENNEGKDTSESEDENDIGEWTKHVRPYLDSGGLDEGTLYSGKWKLNLLYDSHCVLCEKEIGFFKSTLIKRNAIPIKRARFMLRQEHVTYESDEELAFNLQSPIIFTDLNDASYDPAARHNGGVTYEQGMGRMHAVTREGEVVEGIEVFRLTYAEMGTWKVLVDIQASIYASMHPYTKIYPCIYI